MEAQLEPTASNSPPLLSGYFSRVELRDDDRALRLLCRDGYRLHQALWRLFAEGGAKDRSFLYRAYQRDEPPGFYVVSPQPPRYEDPLWQVHSKAYSPRIVTGERLVFSLRANPVITRRAGKDGKSTRHDVVMDAKKHPEQYPDATDIVRAVGLIWLRARAERHGFRVDQVSVDGYRQHRLFKSRARPIAFSTLDFEGLLTVIDPERLVYSLFYGVGPAKGFGCGLLLVRRDL